AHAAPLASLGFSRDEHGRIAHDDGAAVGCQVAEPGGGLALDEHRERSQGDHVGRTHADTHVADARGRHAADQHWDAPWREDRSTDMRHQNGHHRTDMHVSNPGRRHSHDASLLTLWLKLPCSEPEASATQDTVAYASGSDIPPAS